MAAAAARVQDGAAMTRRRPTTEETFAAAVDLATRGSTSFKRFARRYSLCAADAEDAYQRSLEILLTKAPTANRTELRAWLHTVIKHEALALRRQRERALAGSDGGELPDPRGESSPALDEEASGHERVHQTAEALAHLKQSELQCLLLKALGYSYDEIARRTGYSWTKVNRSLTEGRRRFLERFGELASGAHCADFQAVLSAASDGEASAEQERLLKRHLTGCGSCRAALRSYRTAPRRVAELLPPGVLLPLAQQGNLWSRVTDAIGVGAGDRAGALAWKLQQGAEAVGAGKAAAVVASTAALAGGAAVQEHRSDHHPAARSAAHAERTDRARAAQAVPAPRPEPVAAPAPAAPAAPGAARAADPDPVPAEEFAPAAAAAAASTPAPPARVSAGASGGGGGEFGP
jgi:RNA polymerase sigma factor (sigma-70 family)